MQTKNKGFISPALLLLVLAVVAIALIVLFVFSQSSSTTTTPQVLSPQDAIVEKLENVGTSDQVSAIEKDVNATDLNELDKELNQVETDSKEL